MGHRTHAHVAISQEGLPARRLGQHAVGIGILAVLRLISPVVTCRGAGELDHTYSATCTTPTLAIQHRPGSVPGAAGFSSAACCPGPCSAWLTTTAGCALQHNGDQEERQTLSLSNGAGLQSNLERHILTCHMPCDDRIIPATATETTIIGSGCGPTMWHNILAVL